MTPLEKNVSARHEETPLWRTLLNSLPLILLFSALTVFLYKFGWFQWVENATLDFTSKFKTLRTGNVFLIEITDNDYKQIFHSHSPLDINKLNELLAATASGAPKVIVLDLDLGSQKVSVPESFHGTVVRAVSCDVLDEPRTASILNVPVEGLPLLPVCARTILKPHSAGIASNIGLAFLPRDVDGLIRRYCRRLKVLNESDNGNNENGDYNKSDNNGDNNGNNKNGSYNNERVTSTGDALPWSIAKAFEPGLARKESSESNEVFLTLAKDQSDIPSVSAADALDSKDSSGWRDIIGGKIAIIGGAYQESRDVYKTAAGEMSGMRIVAQAVESELQFGGVKSVSEIWLLLSQLVASVLFVVINHKFRQTMIPLLGLVAIPFAAAVFSLVAFNTFALWSSFVPVLFVVQFHALFEHIRDVRRNNRDLKVTNEALRSTRKELARAIDQGGQAERKRISRGLHDETLMYLFELETVIDDLRNSETTAAVYDKARDVIQKTRKNIREVMNDLYPSFLKDHGLSLSIKTLTESLSKPDLKITFEDSGTDNSTLSESIQLRIFKIAQNALRNAIEHSQAAQIAVSLETAEGALLLTISDDGRGFESLDGRSDSQGVRNMKDYADLLDAKIDWRTPSLRFGKGTEVVLRVPLMT